MRRRRLAGRQPYQLRATATRTTFDGLRPCLRGGQRRATTTTRTASCRRWPRASNVGLRGPPTQHFTEPPPRYTEATLIKALEEHGIGRPSTYAADHVDDPGPRIRPASKDGACGPSSVGEVTDLLIEHFGEYVDLEFTAGWKRSSTRSPAASVRGCHCCATSTAR